MKPCESLHRQIAQQTRRKEEARKLRDMWKRLALGSPCADGHRRFPRFS